MIKLIGKQNGKKQIFVADRGRTTQLWETKFWNVRSRVRNTFVKEKHGSNLLILRNDMSNMTEKARIFKFYLPNLASVQIAVSDVLIKTYLNYVQFLRKAYINSLVKIEIPLTARKQPKHFTPRSRPKTSTLSMHHRNAKR